MTAPGNFQTPDGNLNHVYFFLNRNASPSSGDRKSVQKIVPPHLRTSSQRSSHNLHTANNNVVQMNPLAPSFQPSFAANGGHTTHVPLATSQLFELRQTPNKGLGLFAIKHIPCGTMILCELPLLRVPSGSPKTVWGAYCKLSDAQKATFNSLHGFHTEESKRGAALSRFLLDPYGIRPQNEEVNRQLADFERVWGIFSANGFQIPPHDTGIFTTATRINHSCVPNVHHSYNPTLKSETVFAAKDIQPNEELCTTYTGGPASYKTRATRIEGLERRYGFTCDCPACTDQTGDSDARREFMHGIAWGLGEFQKGSEFVADFMPADVSAALKQSEDLIALLLEEGLVTMELMKAYRTASMHACTLEEYEKALLYANNEADIERTCLGPEIGDLVRLGAASQCWMEKLRNTIKRERGDEAVRTLQGATNEGVKEALWKRKQKLKKQKQKKAAPIVKSTEGTTWDVGAVGKEGNW